eukprot:1295915-Rhodomonas_salina.1
MSFANTYIRDHHATGRNSAGTNKSILIFSSASINLGPGEGRRRLMPTATMAVEFRDRAW